MVVVVGSGPNRNGRWWWLLDQVLTRMVSGCGCWIRLECVIYVGKQLSQCGEGGGCGQ